MNESVITAANWLGAILKLGKYLRLIRIGLKCDSIVLMDFVRVYLPHIFLQS
ncbi:uncharacterized protein METZ01_LOCUS24962 [marine metagenome]|uniref:Uncharacterized protein n=1 Tax=marine metagenome TaxID=408172 RepID=A0A381PZM9_9ZZZZ